MKIKAAITLVIIGSIGAILAFVGLLMGANAIVTIASIILNIVVICMGVYPLRNKRSNGGTPNTDE
jgi:hypothetical protein